MLRKTRCSRGRGWAAKKNIRNISGWSRCPLPSLRRQFTTPKWACLLSGRVLTQPRPLRNKCALEIIAGVSVKALRILENWILGKHATLSAARSPMEPHHRGSVHGGTTYTRCQRGKGYVKCIKRVSKHFARSYASGSSFGRVEWCAIEFCLD